MNEKPWSRGRSSLLLLASWNCTNSQWFQKSIEHLSLLLTLKDDNNNLKIKYIHWYRGVIHKVRSHVLLTLCTFWLHFDRCPTHHPNGTLGLRWWFSRAWEITPGRWRDYPASNLRRRACFFFFRLNVAWSTVFKNFYSLFGWRFFTGFYHGRSLLNHQLGNISLIFSHHLTVSKSKKTQQFVDFDVFYRSLLFGGHLNGGTAIGWFGDVDELGGCTLFQDVSLVGKNHIIRLDQPIA